MVSFGFITGADFFVGDEPRFVEDLVLILLLESTERLRLLLPFLVRVCCTEVFSDRLRSFDTDLDGRSIDWLRWLFSVLPSCLALSDVSP